MGEHRRAFAVGLFCTLSLCLSVSLLSAEEDLMERAQRIHREAVLIDTHSDATKRFQDEAWDFSARHEEGHMDLPRMREGGLDAQFFAVWMGEQSEGDGRAVKKAIDQINSIYEVVRRNADDLVLATSADGIRTAAAQGKIAAVIAIEGGHIIEDDLRALRTYYRLGARYMTLTHSFHTTWADSAGVNRPLRPRHGGLTDFGREVVREMNRLGMMVDVSHVADSTFWDVLEVSAAPVLASHSGCRAVADHPRNLTDDMIKAMAAKGGVLQINFYPGYIDPRKMALAEQVRSQYREVYERYGDDRDAARRECSRLFREAMKTPSPASVIIDHIEHVINLVGDDHVGLGADWDGVPSLPVGMEDCSKLPYITLELLRRGHSEETIKKVLGGNLLRLMEEVEQAGVELQLGGSRGSGHGQVADGDMGDLPSEP